MVRGVTYSKTESSDEPLLEYFPVLRANNIQAGKLVFSDLVYVPKKCIAPHQFIKAGDVVVAMSSGSKSVVGKAAKAVSDWEGAFGAFCGVLRPSNEVNHRYFYFFTQSAEYRTRVSELSAGVNINNLKPAHFEMIEIAVAPLAEQTRIAAKLDELLARVDTLKARVDGIPALLMRFRQSVLAAAVSGQLTEEWRGAVNAADWSLTSLGAIAKRLHQGINTSADKVEYSDSGVPILQAKHITSGKIVIADARLVNAELFEKYKEKYCPPSGSILFTNIGTIGRSVVAGNSANYLIAWNIFLIEPSHNVVPEYLRMFLELLRLQGYYESLYRGGATQFVNKKQLSAIEISLPPVEEQTEIVRRVEQLFAFADQLQARVKATQARIDRLTQSILAKAFRGELVPQDPNDEPASVLLERIKAQRAAVPKARRGRRTATLS